MLDKLAVGFDNGVVLRTCTLKGGAEDAELVFADDGLAELTAFLNVEEPGADAALLGEQIALVLDYHLDRGFESAASSRIETRGFRINYHFVFPFSYMDFLCVKYDENLIFGLFRTLETVDSGGTALCIGYGICTVVFIDRQLDH